MKVKLLCGLLLAFSSVTGADASIPYRVQQVGTAETGEQDDIFALAHRFYFGGAYNFSMWNTFTDKKDVRTNGKNTDSFEGLVGIRLYDIFRLETNYIRTVAKYNAFKLTGDTVMLNAIFDARIDSLYRLFYRQRLVPYLGIGAGASWNSATNTNISNKISPTMSVMAGLGLELGEYFTVDFGYRYFYMLTPKFDNIRDLAPSANQFRAGVRINF